MTSRSGFVHVIIVLVAIMVPTFMMEMQVDRVVALARFRNLSRWGGLSIALLGIALAEVVSANLGVMPDFDFELGFDFAVFDVSLFVPMELLEVVAAVLAGTGGMVMLGQGNKRSRSLWEASRVISAPVDGDADDGPPRDDGVRRPGLPGEGGA